VSEQNSGQPIQGGALRPKLGMGKFGGFDPAAIAKAEAALKNLSSNFSQWLQDEVDKLEAARQALRTGGVTAHNLEGLYLRAHDLKGLGATYGFPLITRVAASLCLLTEDEEKRAQAPMALIDAHIDAIRAAVAQDIRDDENPLGRELAETLEAQVAACA
jgi:hypothetical protein